MCVFVNAGIGFQAVQAALMWSDMLRDQAFGHWLRGGKRSKIKTDIAFIKTQLDESSRWHVAAPAPFNYNIIQSFFNHASLFIKKRYSENRSTDTLMWESSPVTCWAWERLACLIEWEGISSSDYLLQSSLSGSGQFTCLPVCLAYHYVSLCWPHLTHFNSL